MRNLLLPSALALLLGLAGPAFAQGANMKDSSSSGSEAAGKEMSGIVQEVNKDNGHIVIDGETFMMEPGGGATMMPATGDEVTLYYEEKGDQKVITRIGQKQ